MISFSGVALLLTRSLIRPGKSQGRLINIIHNDAAQTKWLFLSHIVENYTEALRDLIGVTTGTWSEQYRNVQASRRKRSFHHLRNFIDFFNIQNPFKVPVNELINIATGVIASDDVNVDAAVDIRTKIVFGLDDKVVCNNDKICKF